MLKQVFEVDSNGFLVNVHVIKESEEVPDNCIVAQPPNGLYRPKWTGVEWVEDMTQEEIDELNNQPRELTEVERQHEIINTLGQELAQLKLQFLMGGM